VSSYTVVDHRRNAIVDALSTSAHGGAAAVDRELEYQPLVGPSVWLKIPNRDPKKVGALQRFDRAQLDKLSERVAEAYIKLARAEKEERVRQDEAKRQQEQERIAQFKKPGTRVYYNLFLRRPSKRVYGTAISLDQAKALGAVSQHAGERDTVTYAIMDGTGRRPRSA
jgi:hypothetical protein